jgi:hypothetical protein
MSYHSAPATWAMVARRAWFNVGVVVCTAGTAVLPTAPLR